MVSFLDKILIYCFGAITILMNNTNEILVAYLLAGILILSVYQLLMDYESIIAELLLFAITVGVLIESKELVLYLPIVFYHHIYQYCMSKNRINYLLYGIDGIVLVYFIINN